MKQEQTKQDNKFDNIVIVAFILIVALVIFFAKDSTSSSSSTTYAGARGIIKTSDNVIVANEVNGTRNYPNNDFLSTVIGYVNNKVDENTTIKGVKGIEKSYNDELNSSEDIVLNIPFKLQQSIEQIADQYKSKLEADEVVVSIMESKTGKILSLATSNRFDPNNIAEDSIAHINNNAIEYQYEPGSIMKPITVALALEKGRVTLSEELPAYNDGKKDKDGYYPKGKIMIDRWGISDDQQFKKNTLTIEDIVVSSSNIGALQLANRLSGKELLDGYKSFGITESTGIDLSYEAKGYIPTLAQLSSGENLAKMNIFKSTISYGQGINSTFIQLLSAYNVFNNDGNYVVPSIVQNVIDNPSHKIVSTKTTATIKDLLIKAVTEGTVKNTFVDGLEIGGKTGTANIAGPNGYEMKYNSSFFGFANDKDHKYTIGVMVKNPISTGDHGYYHYASNSAVPVFKEVVEDMMKFQYLKNN